MTSKTETPKVRGSEPYTSVYLDEKSRTKLDSLAKRSGQSRSQVMRGLIQGADGDQHQRLSKIAAELIDLIGARTGSP